MKLSAQFERIIADKMQTLPVKKVGDVFIDGVETDSNRGVDVTGTPFTSYEPETVRRKGGQRLVNLRDRSRSIETLDNAESMTDSSKASTTLRFDGNAGYGNSTKSAGSVFYYHQKGTARGGKMRRIFPEDSDENSAGVQDKLDKIEIILAEHFNE